MSVDPYVSEAAVLNAAMSRPELCHLTLSQIEQRLHLLYDDCEGAFDVYGWDHPVSPDVASLVAGGFLPGRVYRRNSAMDHLLAGSAPCLLCNQPDKIWTDSPYPLAHMVKGAAPMTNGEYWTGLCSTCRSGVRRLGGDDACENSDLFWPTVGVMLGEYPFKSRAKKHADTWRRFDPRIGRAQEAA